jgi:predicted nuclease of restriction endonuclease-like (RecB) superfamily
MKDDQLDQPLYQELSVLVEGGKQKIATRINSGMILTFWQVGKKINEHILNNKRADYSKQIVSTASTQLEKQFGRNFTLRNVRRMIQFANQFEDLETVFELSQRLSWSHFIELLPLKNQIMRSFYAKHIAEESWSVHFTRQQIERKVFERNQIAALQLNDSNPQLKHTFKDPYFLDFLGLKEGYLEYDLETAILKELELFILELGKGFAFVERQKRMIIDDEDFYLDLLFYHRKLKRLVAIELKIGKFKAAHKGQMELYLKWLTKYEKQEGENNPIGLILCAEASNEQVELLEMGKDGILVAEYWTELPSKNELERKLHTALLEAKDRVEKKKLE